MVFFPTPKISVFSKGVITGRVFGGDQSLLYHKNIEAFFSRQLGGARRSTQSTAIAPPVSFSYSYLLLHSIINISLLSWIENRAPVSETRSFFLLNAAAVNYHHQRYHFPCLEGLNRVSCKAVSV